MMQNPRGRQLAGNLFRGKVTAPRPVAGTKKTRRHAGGGRRRAVTFPLKKLPAHSPASNRSHSRRHLHPPSTMALAEYWRPRGFCTTSIEATTPQPSCLAKAPAGHGIPRAVASRGAAQNPQWAYRGYRPPPNCFQQARQSADLCRRPGAPRARPPPARDVSPGKGWAQTPER